MPKKKPLLYPVVFMVLITAFFTFVLALINASTIDVIKLQEELNIQRSILYVFDIPFDADDDDEVKSLYTQAITVKNDDGREIFHYYEEDQLIGYAFQFGGRGLWGTITGHVALTPNFDELLGVNFIAHSETPGLGGRIDELAYKEQFRGLIPASAEEAIIHRPADNANVDGITGATLTSNSVKKMLNTFMVEIIEYGKEAGLNESN